MELIGVRFDGMGRSGGFAGAAPVLREHGFGRIFGDAEAAADVVAPAPVPHRRDGVGYLNEDALVAMVAELHERVVSALEARRFPLVYGADCSVLLAAVPALGAVVGRPGLLHLDAHEDATPIARSDNGEAANMEVRLLAGLGDALEHLQAVTSAWWLHVDLDVLRREDFSACGARTSRPAARLANPSSPVA